MFQIVRCMLDEKGDVVVRSPTEPVFELREDAAAMAEFDASRVAGDYGYDEERDSWWAIDSGGRMYRFNIEQVATANFAA
jgi:hypothetical protein